MNKAPKLAGGITNERHALTLSLSPWERGRFLNGCERTPSPMGRGLG